MKAKVYFSREITPEKVVELYRTVGRELGGRVCGQTASTWVSSASASFWL